MINLFIEKIIILVGDWLIFSCKIGNFVFNSKDSKIIVNIVSYNPIGHTITINAFQFNIAFVYTVECNKAFVETAVVLISMYHNFIKT